MEEIILDLAKNRTKLLFSKFIDKDVTIIIDFYNIYCNIIKFNKYKTFSKESYRVCLNLLLKKLKHNKVIIVSKDIFEVDTTFIKNITLANSNITYVIVDDMHEIKSKNTERDDFVCLLFRTIHKRDNIQSVIVSNDTYKNHSRIYKNIKPFKLRIISDGTLREVDIMDKALEKYKDIDSFSDRERIGFYFKNKK